MLRMLSFLNPNNLPFIIDWSAWATFVAGIAAVIGAVVVGVKQAGIASRQAGIADRQAHIMERQVEITAQQAETERTRLLAELYDRRVVIYSGVEQYISQALTDDGNVSDLVRDKLFSALAVSRFILGDDVEDITRNIHKTATSLKMAMGRHERLPDEGADARRDELLEKIYALNDTLIGLQGDLDRSKDKYLRITKVNLLE